MCTCIHACLNTFAVATFDPDSRFISNVLSRLEAVMGVHIISILADIHYQLNTSAGVQLQPQIKNGSLPDPQSHPCQYVEEVISQWSAGCSPRPPTWRELLQVLQDIGLLELRQQIEVYMKGICNYLCSCFQNRYLFLAFFNYLSWYMEGTCNNITCVLLKRNSSYSHSFPVLQQYWLLFGLPTATIVLLLPRQVPRSIY